MRACTGFGEKHFGRIFLGDVRRTRRLVETADALWRRPRGSLPEKMGDPAALKGLYRLMDQDLVTHDRLISQHRAQVHQSMAQGSGVVLLLQDATEFNYTSRTSLADQLGSIGRGQGKGYLCHHILAVEEKDQQVLGIASQILFKRPIKPRDESRQAKRARKDRESLLWQTCRDQVGEAPAGKRWVDVADRGADIFEFLEHQCHRGRCFVVRSKYDRKLHAEDARALTLHGLARCLKDLGQTTLEVQSTLAQPGRTAQVRVAAGHVQVQAPPYPRGQHGKGSLDLEVVHVQEIDPPAHGEAVEWILLTNLACHSLEAALTVAGYYATRWVIEEYHKAQKSGCSIEQPQFTEVQRLEPLIALLSVVAVELLKLRDAARRKDRASQPARQIMPQEAVTVLSAWRWKDQDRQPTILEFMLALARLGGHQNRKADGLPGWITLWKGWIALQDMIRGVRAMQLERCGQT